MRMNQAICEALAHEMRADPSVVIFGEDVAAAGGVFKATEGLLEEFGPMRVRDTPISEGAILGAAVGAAMAGMRPVAEIMFAEFFGVALDQIVTLARGASTQRPGPSGRRRPPYLAVYLFVNLPLDGPSSAPYRGERPSSRRSVGQAEAVGIIAVPGGRTDKGLYGAYALAMRKETRCPKPLPRPRSGSSRT